MIAQHFGDRNYDQCRNYGFKLVKKLREDEEGRRSELYAVLSEKVMYLKQQTNDDSKYETEQSVQTSNQNATNETTYFKVPLRVCKFWTEHEKVRFIQALKMFGKNFRLIAQYVGNRTYSMCQKYASTLRKQLKRGDFYDDVLLQIL